MSLKDEILECMAKHNRPVSASFLMGELPTLAATDAIFANLVKLEVSGQVVLHEQASDDSINWKFALAEQAIKSPPLGIMPRNIWLKNRAIELHEAIGRYIVRETFNDHVEAWTVELLAIIEEIKE